MTAREAYETAAAWNRDHPPGTPVLAWPGVIDSQIEPLRTRTRGSAWILGDADVVCRVDGYAGGIAITHLEYDPTRQPAVPDIAFDIPPCPICGDELQCDGDGFGCWRCYAIWPMSGANGRWDNPNASRCDATVRPLFGVQSSLVERCALSRAHEGTHASVGSLGIIWNDDDEHACFTGAGAPAAAEEQRLMAGKAEP